MADLKRQDTSGFSLIELSIVLIIISTLVGMIVFSLQARLDASKLYLTKQRMQMIMDAMDRYVETYGHLPCPAARLQRTNANFGISTANASAAPYCPSAESLVDQVGTTGPTANRAYRGDLPFKTLGLDSQIMVDGWGNRFDYMVVNEYTTVSNFTSSSSSYDYIFKINNPANSHAPNLDVAYVLLSHGSNLVGGYIDKTATLVSDSVDGVTTIDLENSNSDNDATFYQATLSKDNDDILVFKTRWQLPTYININQ